MLCHVYSPVVRDKGHHDTTSSCCLDVDVVISGPAPGDHSARAEPVNKSTVEATGVDEHGGGRHCRVSNIVGIMTRQCVKGYSGLFEQGPLPRPEGEPVTISKKDPYHNRTL